MRVGWVVPQNKMGAKQNYRWQRALEHTIGTSWCSVDKTGVVVAERRVLTNSYLPDFVVDVTQMAAMNMSKIMMESEKKTHMEKEFHNMNI